MSVPLPDYAVLDRQLRSAGAAISPSELHGVVCGLLCTAGRQAASSWLTEQRGTFDGPAGDVDAASALLDSVESASWASLSGHVLEFVPLLPDDTIDLAERTSALGQFCLGFVGGLALGGWTDAGEPQGGDDVHEIVRDLSAISNAGFDAADEDDADGAEFSYVELAEYVRVGVQFVFETMADSAAAPPSPTLH